MGALRAYLLLGLMTVALLVFTVLVRAFVPHPAPRVEPTVVPDSGAPAMYATATGRSAAVVPPLTAEGRRIVLGG